MPSHNAYHLTWVSLTLVVEYVFMAAPAKCSHCSLGDGIPVELFQILKDDAVKVLHSICQQIGKTQQGHRTGKRSVFIPIPKKGNAKECSNYCTIVLISHTSKVILKILQVRLPTVHELRASRCSNWILKRQRNQRSYCQHPLDHRISRRIPVFLLH